VINLGLWKAAVVTVVFGVVDSGRVGTVTDGLDAAGVTEGSSTTTTWHAAVTKVATHFPGPIEGTPKQPEPLSGRGSCVVGAIEIQAVTHAV
jgi:hypothetical protein